MEKQGHCFSKARVHPVTEGKKAGICSSIIKLTVQKSQKITVREAVLMNHPPVQAMEAMAGNFKEFLAMDFT